MNLKVFPYDFEYKLEGSEIFVYSYSKLEDGIKVVLKHQHEVFFYAKLESIDIEGFKKRLKDFVVQDGGRNAKVIRFEKVSKELNGTRKEFFKIYVNYPKAVPIIAKKIQGWGIECYEKDILFIHRYLRDTGIIPMMEVEVSGEYIDKGMFLVKKIVRNGDVMKKWKVLALDIETYAKKKEIDMNQNPILMVALYGTDCKKVITWKKFPTKDKTIEFVENEKRLIERCGELINEYSPEILTGYFSDGFDLPYINTRAEILGAKFEIGKMITRKTPRTTEVKINGILHLDMLKFVKQIFGLDLKVENYSLDTVSGKLLGSRKKVVNLEELSSLWDSGGDRLEEFCKYNLQDSKLTFDLCEKLLMDMIEFSLITGLPTFDVTRMRFGRLVESYIMKKAMDLDIIAPNRPGDEEIKERMNESIQGGFVFEPTPGLYKDLAVFDFRSLYPTIIVSHNIGPDSLKCECCSDKKVPGEEYWFCRKEKGFLPSLLREIIDKRTAVKNEIKRVSGKEKGVLEAKSYALKIMANSFYGYLGFYGARWYSIESAASTTAYARYYIKDTAKKAGEVGFKVCYIDTDSLFFMLGDKKLEDALGFMNLINSKLPGNMELEFEGHFLRGIFVGIKGSVKGAKKKYALLKEDGDIKITGFETVRRNWSILAKEVQKDVLKFVLNDKIDEALNYVKAVVKDLKKGNVSKSRLILKTQITRELNQYKSIGPHIKVAREMVKNGETVKPGTVIKYVIAEGSGLIRDKAKLPNNLKEGDYDHDYYINHQLIPAVLSIFNVFGYSEEDIFNESSQKGLASFI